MSRNDVGVPVKLLQEFVGKKIVVDTAATGLFVGELDHADENLSMSLIDVQVTFLSGVKSDMKSVYIKGSKVRYIGLPDDAKSILSELTRARPPMRRGGFRGGRGGSRGFRRGGGGGGGRSRRY